MLCYRNRHFSFSYQWLLVTTGSRVAWRKGRDVSFVQLSLEQHICSEESYQLDNFIWDLNKTTWWSFWRGIIISRRPSRMLCWVSKNCLCLTINSYRSHLLLARESSVLWDFESQWQAFSWLGLSPIRESPPEVIQNGPKLWAWSSSLSSWVLRRKPAEICPLSDCPANESHQSHKMLSPEPSSASLPILPWRHPRTGMFHWAVRIAVYSDTNLYQTWGGVSRLFVVSGQMLKPQRLAPLGNSLGSTGVARFWGVRRNTIWPEPRRVKLK